MMKQQEINKTIISLLTDNPEASIAFISALVGVIAFIFQYLVIRGDQAQQKKQKIEDFLMGAQKLWVNPNNNMSMLTKEKTLEYQSLVHSIFSKSQRKKHSKKIARFRIAILLDMENAKRLSTCEERLQQMRECAEDLKLCI